MKKLVLGLMLVMGLSLVGCGNAKDEVVNGGGFTPSKPSTETEVETEEEVVVSLEMSVEEMKEYYNDNQFVGTPRVEIGVIKYNKVFDYTQVWSETASCTIENTSEVKPDKSYICIIVDNGTPDDYTDDEIAYIFTTPIEE